MRRSKLNLVDLAGSERVSRTNIDGTVLREAKYINLTVQNLDQVRFAVKVTCKGRRYCCFHACILAALLKQVVAGQPLFHCVTCRAVPAAEGWSFACITQCCLPHQQKTLRLLSSSQTFGCCLCAGAQHGTVPPPCALP